MLLFAAAALAAPTMNAQTALKHGAHSNSAEVQQTGIDARSGFQDVQVRSAATARSTQLSSPVQNFVLPSNNVSLSDQMRQATGGITIVGNVIYSSPAEGQTSGNAHLGIYSFKTDDTGWEELLKGNLGCYAAVAIDGVYYNYVAVKNILGSYNFYCRTYDMETWEEIASKTITNAKTPRALATDGTNVYGCFYNGQSGDAAGYEYGKLDLNTNEHTVICTLPQNWNACAWGNDGMIYAIDMLGDLYKVVPATGNMTKVGATGKVPKYITGATVDKKSGRMFWTLCPEDENGYLCEVNLTTGAATQLCQFKYGDEVAGIYVPFIANDKAPAAVTGLAATFANGSLSGKVTFKCPTTLFDGTAASGALTYKVLANGQQVATGNTSFGATVSADVTVSKADNYTLTVIVSNSNGDGPKTKTDLFIGKDTPKPTTVTIAYNNGKFNVKWTPVTETVNGGYMDLSKITYTVTRYPDKKVVAQAATGTSLEDAVAVPATYTMYYYTVVVNCESLSSSAAESNKVPLGEIAAPYTETFDDASAMDTYTVIDANDDGKTWAYVKADQAVRASYNSKNEMNDWLITPGIKLEAGKTYMFSVKMRNHSASSYPEKFEIKMGKDATVAAMTKSVVAETTLNGKVWTTFETYVTPTESGPHFFGIHGMSDKNMFYLYADSIAVSAPIDGGAPGAATNLTATADASGALKAVIKGKAPSKTLAGQNLSSITKIDIQRDGETVKTLTGINPGAEFTFNDDAVPTNGNHTWTIICSNDKGAGMKAEVSAFVGFDVPAAVTDVKMTETADGKVHITWKAPTTDVNGKPLGSTPITYKVVNASKTSEVYADNLTGTTLDYTVCTEGQNFFQVGIFAISASGVSEGIAGPFMAIGFPYTMPYLESFANGALTSILGIQKVAGQGATWNIQKDGGLGITSVDSDNGYISGKMQYLNDAGMVFTGKIDLTNAANPAFSFYTYNIVSIKDGAVQYDINELDVKIREVGTEEWTVLKHGTVNELCGGDTAVWKQIKVSLNAYKGKKVQVGVQGTCKHYIYVMFDKLQVAEDLAHNLGISGISAPATVKPNEEFAVSVEVENRGGNPASDYNVEFYRGNASEPFKTIKGVAIAPGATSTFNAPVKLGFDEADASATYHAVVKYSQDLNDADNTSDEVTVSRVYTEKAAPKDLKGQFANNKVELNWVAPTITGGSTGMADLENLPSWENQSVKGWTFVDVDQKPRGGFQNKEIPNNAVQSKGSWFVFDASDESTWNQSFKAHSGTKYFASLFNYDASQVDDWLISPQLDGTKQTIKFWARSYSKSYPETMELLYSTTDKNTTSFTSVQQVASVPETWTEYTIEVPAGAKYFAVRNNGADKFMLMLDDFTFKGLPESVTGYNVYRDGEKLNSDLVTSTTFTDNNPHSGNNNYYVTAVYSDGEESAPVKVTVNAGVGMIEAGVSVTAGNGFITVNGAEGKPVAIVGVNGVEFFNGIPKGDLKVEVAPGVYMVRVNKGVVKLIVK